MKARHDSASLHGGDSWGGAYSRHRPRVPLRRARAKPNSKFAGVQIGLNVPYNFGGRDMNPDELLDRCLKLNVNAVEMRSQPVESFLGSPAANGQKAEAEEMRKWRAAVSMDRVAAFRKKYERRRRDDRDRQIRRHLHHGGRRGGLLLQPRADAGRAGDLVRDRRQAHGAHRPVCRQAQADGRPITATRRRRRRTGSRRSSRRSTTGRISTSGISSPATTRRPCRS